MFETRVIWPGGDADKDWLPFDPPENEVVTLNRKFVEHAFAGTAKVLSLTLEHCTIEVRKV